MTTLVVDSAMQTSQRAVRDLRNTDGDGRVTESILQYTSEGVRLQYLKITTTLSGITKTVEFRPSPPPLIAPRGGKPGDHLTFDMTGSGVTANVEVDILRTDFAEIAGSRVNTRVVRVHTTFSGDLEGEDTTDSWFTPDHFLAVKEQSLSTGKVGLAEVRTEYEAALQSLAPR